MMSRNAEQARRLEVEYGAARTEWDLTRRLLGRAVLALIVASNVMLVIDSPRGCVGAAVGGAIVVLLVLSVWSFIAVHGAHRAMELKQSAWWNATKLAAKDKARDDKDGEG